MLALERGMSPGAVTSAAIDGLIRDVALEEVRAALADRLSGSQQRRLCVAMAFVGDPKVVLLDEVCAFCRRFVGKSELRSSPLFCEACVVHRGMCLQPTSGLDLEMRRLVWSLLKRKRAGRVILLTTHVRIARVCCGERASMCFHV